MQIIIFIGTLAMACGFMALVPALLGLPDNLPFEISNIFHQIVSGLYLFDFIIPVAIMLQVFLGILIFDASLLVVDGAIWVWNQISKFKT